LELSATFTATGTANVMSRAVDDTGNLEVPAPGINISVGPATCPCAIWPSTALPVVVDAGSYPALELGVRFWSESNGYITGLRFYKGANDTGAHVADLWSSSGGLLASAAVPVGSESPSGWQQVNFSAPVPITANTVYVASYHTTTGHFAVDHNYFVSAGVDNGPLHALANVVSGGANGVYAYSATSAFPSSTYNSENYWVDVVFGYSAATPQLSISTTSLSNGAPSVPYNQSLLAAGGNPPYGWSLVSGALPVGLTLSSAGLISGTPTASGSSSFTVQVTDASSPVQTATQALSINIAASTGPISVSITPSTSSLQPSGSQEFVATVTNDAANAGVSWTVVPASGTVCGGVSCGAVSPVATASGTPTTYTAAATVPAGGAITITATSVTDSSKSASSTVSIVPTANNAGLNGNYTFAFDGASGSAGNSTAFAAVGRFTADGAGNITNGELDTNSPGSALAAQPFTGTYSVGADQRGVMTLALAGIPAKLAFALMADGNAKFIRFDAAGGSGIIGSGSMEKADTSAYNTAKIAGDYAFGVAGQDNVNNRAALVGRFTSDGAGTLANAGGDVNAYGSVSSLSFTSANYTVLDATSGRGTMSMSFQFGGGSGTLNFVFYIVNAGKLLLIENDTVSTPTPLLTGTVVRQQTPAGGFSNASLNSNTVIYLTGLSACANITGPVPKAVAGLLTPDGNGGLVLTFDENFCRTPNSVTGLVGAYSVAGNGRAVMTLGSDSVIAYLVDLNNAFLFGTDSSVLSGFGEAQAAGPLTNTAVKGTYAGVASSPVGLGVSAFSGEFTADGGSPTGSLTGTEDIGAPAGPISGISFSASYSISSSPTRGRGTVTLTAPSAGNAVAYVVSPLKFVMVSLSDPNPAVWVFEQPLPDAILSGLTLNPASVLGGAQSSTGMVTLGGPAPAGSAQITLSSSNAAASVPSTVTVPAGATSAAFTISTSAVGAPTTATISASYTGVTKSVALTVTPPTVTALTLNPSSVVGGVGSSTGTVTLSGPVPAGGV
jgi:Domain of unknown function (DUF4082)